MVESVENCRNKNSEEPFLLVVEEVCLRFSNFADQIFGIKRKALQGIAMAKKLSISNEKAPCMFPALANVVS